MKLKCRDGVLARSRQRSRTTNLPSEWRTRYVRRMTFSPRLLTFVAAVLAPIALHAQDEVAPARAFDVLIKNGTVYDGSGGEPRRADVAIRGDRILAVGNFPRASAGILVDATGLAVAPGFINMLS